MVQIKTEYITLGQLLKLQNVVQDGAEAKMYLADYIPLVNGEDENRRGKKLYPGDSVSLPTGESFTIAERLA